ncbi:MAG: nucleoside hydrolase [Terriglobia bacterium]
MRRAAFLCAFFLLFTAMSAASPPEKIPIILDTDIGTDVDDAFALALILRSPELDLLGVTTVSGDTQARARLAAKMLWEAGRPNVPVAAGEPGPSQPMDQTRRAGPTASPALPSPAKRPSL